MGPHDLPGSSRTRSDLLSGALPGPSSRASPATSKVVRSAKRRCGDSISSPTRCSRRLRRLEREPTVSTESTVPDQLIAAVRSSAARGGTAAWSSLEDGHRRLGKFELLERLGAGSFGYVYRARDTELGRVVAIKIPRAGNLASDEDAARFLREASSAAQLKHPGIVALHETGQADDGTFFLVEEFVQGKTLASRLADGAVSLSTRRPA